MKMMMRNDRENVRVWEGEISGGSETGRERRVRRGGVSFRLFMFLVHCLECVLYTQNVFRLSVFLILSHSLFLILAHFLCYLFSHTFYVSYSLTLSASCPPPPP